MEQIVETVGNRSGSKMADALAATWSSRFVTRVRIGS